MTADRRQRGVTLIELAVAMSVMGLLMLAVLPEMGSWMRNMKVRNAAESIQNGLQRARMEALRRNRPISFWLVKDDINQLTNACALASDSAAWVVSRDDPSGKCASTPDLDTAPAIVEKGISGDGAAGVTVASVASDGATGASSVTFNGFGQVSGSSGIAMVQLRLTDARRLDVVVSSGGTIRMCDRDVTSDSDPRKCP